MGHDPARSASIVLRDDNGTCKVAQRRPQDIYVGNREAVAWVVLGSCRTAPQVEIDRRFKSGGQTEDIFTPGSRLETVGEQGRTIIGTLKDGVASGTKGRKFEYTILINGQPAEYASRADDGILVACPVWPCKY
jgi:hypothetical protein